MSTTARSLRRLLKRLRFALRRLLRPAGVASRVDLGALGALLFAGRRVALAIAVSLLAAVVAGCTSARLETSFDPCRETAVVIPDALDAERTGAIEEGLAPWRAALGMPWRVEPGPVEGDVARVPVSFVDSAWFFGRFEDRTGRIELSNQVGDPGALAVVLAHELGHALGLYHVAHEVRASVMNPGNVSVGPTEADVMDVKALWGVCEADEPRRAGAAAPRR